jgi:hypothetical protein
VPIPTFPIKFVTPLLKIEFEVYKFEVVIFIPIFKLDCAEIEFDEYILPENIFDVKLLFPF